MNRNVRHGVLLGAAVAALVGPLVASPSEATIGWDGGTLVVPQGTLEERRPQVVVDSDGDRHVAYSDADADVWLAEVGSRGALGTPVRLFDSSEQNGGGYPRLAIDDQDRITVVWYVTDASQGSRSHVESRTVGADGQLGATQVLSDLADNAYYPEVVVDSAGVATVVWENEIGGGWPGRVQAVRLAAGSGSPSGPVVDLDDPGGEVPDGIGVGDVTVAMDASDRATVAWVRFDGNGSEENATIRAVRLTAEGDPGATQLVSDDPSTDHRYPRIAIAPDGTATVVYTRFGGVAATMATRLSAADGTPGTPVLLSDPQRDTLDDPAVTVDDQGRVTVAWFSYGAEGSWLETRRIGADGAPEPERAPVGRKGNTLARMELIALASDSKGRVVVAWPGADGRRGQETRMHAVRLSAATGAPSTTHRLSSAGDWDAFGEVVDVAVDSRDRASVVWTRYGATAIRRTLAPSKGLVPANTWILTGPSKGEATEDATPRFTFEASTVEARFQCRLDDGRWRSCSSPMTTGRLDEGRHELAVRAVDADGTPPDPSPAVARFTVR